MASKIFKKSVVITGANGFVGRVLCQRLVEDGWYVRGTVREAKKSAGLSPEVELIVVGEIGSETDWTSVLQGVDAVVHLAGRVHIMKDQHADPLAHYLEVNVGGTVRLAEAAADEGVRRFIYLSSVKVLGEMTEAEPFNEHSQPNPQDPYAISKWEAEQALGRIAQETGLEVVVLRPPLVYGPGVRANFFQLMKIVDRGIPLPLKNIENKRSMIYLGNLTDAIVACLVHTNAAGKVFLVGDNETVSTAELITRIAGILGKPPHLFAIPKRWLKLAAAVFKKSAVVDRLIGSLVVDSTNMRRILGWHPPFSMNDGLKITVQWYVNNKTAI